MFDQEFVDHIEQIVNERIPAVEQTPWENWSHDFHSLQSIAERIHLDNVRAGWWNAAPGSRRPKDDINVLATKIALIHSEVSEALEGLRKDLMDDHLPHRPMDEVEMADAVIRIFDYCGARGYDIAGTIQDKLMYNQRRADHKLEARAAEGGKKI